VARGRQWWTVPGRAGAIALLGLASLGMGGLGGGRDAGQPLRDVRGTFVDVDGNRVAASHVTVGGDVVLEGDLGRGHLRVPLDQVARIALAPADERDRVRAELTLRAGEPVTLLLRSSTTFYGQVPSGAYQIRARDLRSVELQP
jgi:hypothetical protein